MKTCRYCLSELEDLAAVCRFCARPHIVGAGEVLALSQFFTLAKAAQGGFGIWSAAGGGQTLAHFEGTEKGWRKASSKWDTIHREQPTSYFGVAFPIG